MPLRVPEQGHSHFWIVPEVSIKAFERVLDAFARDNGVGPDKHIVLVLDQAGWHVSGKLKVLEGITLVFLPSHAPELQRLDESGTSWDKRHVLDKAALSWPNFSTSRAGPPTRPIRLSGHPAFRASPPAERLWGLTDTPPVNKHFESFEQLQNTLEPHLAWLETHRERIRAFTLFLWWPRTTLLN